MVDLERSTQLTSGPEIRDVAANRSEYEPKAGLHYKATDTAAEFIGDGERWNKIETTGANPSFRSVDTEQLYTESRQADAVLLIDDVGDYVARGPNGEIASSSTDVSAVIDAVVADFGYGTTIDARPGTYEYTSKWDLTDSMMLRGTAAGINGTRFMQADGANTDFIHWNPSGHDELFPVLKHFRIDGNWRSGNNNTAGKGIQWGAGGTGNTKDMRIHDVYFRDLPGIGIDCQGQWGMFLSKLVVEQCGRATSEYSIVIDGDSDASLWGSKIADNYGGIQIASGHDELKVGLTQFDRNDKSGIVAAGSECQFIGCESDGNGAYNVVSQGDRNQFIGCMVGNAGSDDIWDSGVDNNFSDTFAKDNVALTVRNEGTRPRWNGTVGGGVFGGVDLSLAGNVGQFEGDRTLSSGATANTGDNAYSYWTWDSTNSVWNDGNGNTV